MCELNHMSPLVGMYLSQCLHSRISLWEYGEDISGHLKTVFQNLSTIIEAI